MTPSSDDKKIALFESHGQKGMHADPLRLFQHQTESFVHRPYGQRDFVVAWEREIFPIVENLKKLSNHLALENVKRVRDVILRSMTLTVLYLRRLPEERLTAIVFAIDAVTDPFQRREEKPGERKEYFKKWFVGLSQRSQSRRKSSKIGDHRTIGNPELARRLYELRSEMVHGARIISELKVYNGEVEVIIRFDEQLKRSMFVLIEAIREVSAWAVQQVEQHSHESGCGLTREGFEKLRKQIIGSSSRR